MDGRCSTIGDIKMHVNFCRKTWK